MGRETDQLDNQAGQLELLSCMTEANTADARKGQVVRADTGVSHHYRFKIPMGKELEPFKTYIVMSTLPAGQLPTSMRHGVAQEVCAVTTVLSPKDMRRKNASWYNLKKEYNMVEFEVRMIIDTGLRFEIWTPDGIRSQSHDESKCTKL